MGKVIKILYQGSFAKLSYFLLLLCICINAKSQTDSSYSFLVAGHAYGAHSGENIGLHPPLLKKLAENPDSSTMALFLTGDIVNQSTTASWNQVEIELSSLGLKSYYVMGNHDDNSVGYAVFEEKHGGAYYSFIYDNGLYIILNSTESGRSISLDQLKFLDEVLENNEANWERAFIFFHEVIWNNIEKYKDVRSNSRSRYSQLVNISNFWSEVYPRLSVLEEKKFYLFAGDVGGNPDAIAASFDSWENVTLISSGMGEVNDENYLKVSVLPDTVTFQLIPLNNEVEINPITWYNIPVKPDSIFGPSTVLPLQSDVNYRIAPINNATNYKWILSTGITGSSDSSQINLHFDNDFQSGRILVSAVNDGFGESEPAELKIVSDNNTSVSEKISAQRFRIQQDQISIKVNFYSEQIQNAQIKIYDFQGKVVVDEQVLLNSGFNSKIIDKNITRKGLVIVQLSTRNRGYAKKVMLY